MVNVIDLQSLDVVIWKEARIHEPREQGALPASHPHHAAASTVWCWLVKGALLQTPKGHPIEQPAVAGDISARSNHDDI